MAAIALVGTPRAWQEIGNLLEAAQQKAQLKFWSMVMRPSATAEVELVAAEDSTPAHGVSPCPREGGREESLKLVSYKEPRRPRASSARRRQRTQADSGALIAHAPKAPAVKESVERALRLERLKDADFDFHEVAETVPAPRPRPAAADTLSFVQLPPAAPVAVAFSEKEVACQFRLLKKTLNENKLLLRQRGRLPVRVSAPFPAS